MRQDRSLLEEYNFKLYRPCVTCKEVFEISDFAKDKTCSWGASRRCKSCHVVARKKAKDKYRSSEKGKKKEKEQSRKYYKQNRDIIIEYGKEYRESEKGSSVIQKYNSSQAKKDSANKYARSEKGKLNRKDYYDRNKKELIEKNKQYRKENPEVGRKANKKYYKKNPHMAARAKMKRRTLEGKSRPSWANSDLIKQVYEGSKRLGKLLNKKFHVDHIVPLNHPDVCGLHVWANLQVLEDKINLSKGNKFNKGI